MHNVVSKMDLIGPYVNVLISDRQVYFKVHSHINELVKSVTYNKCEIGIQNGLNCLTTRLHNGD